MADNPFKIVLVAEQDPDYPPESMTLTFVRNGNAWSHDGVCAGQQELQRHLTVAIHENDELKRQVASLNRVLFESSASLANTVAELKQREARDRTYLESALLFLVTVLGIPAGYQLEQHLARANWLPSPASWAWLTLALLCLLAGRRWGLAARPGRPGTSSSFDIEAGLVAARKEHR